MARKSNGYSLFATSHPWGIFGLPTELTDPERKPIDRVQGRHAASVSTARAGAIRRCLTRLPLRYKGTTMIDSNPRGWKHFWISSRPWRRALALALAGALGAGGMATVRHASAARPAAVTPKPEPPNEARVLSRAFSSVAKALGPSVVRIEVEVG